MQRTVLLVFVLTAIHIGAFAQPESYGFDEGAIMLKDSTVIRGYIEVAVTFYDKVSYRLAENSETLEVKTKKIHSVLTNYSYRENITLDGKERMMTLITEGRVQLFSHVALTNSPSQTHSNITLFSGPVIYAIRKDGQLTEVEKKSFKSKLSNLLSDQPTVMARINSDDFEFKNMTDLVKEYNELHRVQALKRQLTARVIDAETKKPVKDAKVTIAGTNSTSTTNHLGFVQITIDVIDDLIIEHPEYEPGQVKVPNAKSFQITLTKQQEKKE